MYLVVASENGPRELFVRRSFTKRSGTISHSDFRRCGKLDMDAGQATMFVHVPCQLNLVCYLSEM